MVNDTSPYCQSARFSSKAAAGAAYTPLQELVLAEETTCDLSVYRLKITEGWHVVVLGDTPPDDLHQRIEALLTQGTLVNLEAERPDVIASLRDRRSQVSQVTDRAEAHYNTTEE